MRNALKAWNQDPDDWRIKYIPKSVKKSLWNGITNCFWSLVNTPMGFFIFIVILCSIGGNLAGMS